MEITKEQIQKLVDISCNRSVEEQLKSWFPDAFEMDLEIGVWYINKDNREGKLIGYYQGKGKCYGFFDEKWGTAWSMSEAKLYRKASVREIEDALIHETMKRRYTDANTIPVNNINYKDKVDKYFNFHYEHSSNRLFSQPDGCGGRLLFQNGIWAEIAKFKEITMQEIADKFGVPVEVIKIKK
jgi:hypothetical protein